MLGNLEVWNSASYRVLILLLLIIIVIIIISLYLQMS